MGAGPIGVLHMLLAQAQGAAKVLVSEPVQGRRNQALNLGADRVVDPIHEDLGQVVQEVSDGRGADVVIVAAPS
jgi:L-iditol 2-dehydrogenase